MKKEDDILCIDFSKENVCLSYPKISFAITSRKVAINVSEITCVDHPKITVDYVMIGNVTVRKTTKGSGCTELRSLTIL